MPRSWNPSSAATPTNGCGSIVAGARGRRASRRYTEVKRQRDRETAGRRDREMERQRDEKIGSLRLSVSPSLLPAVPLMIVAGEASGDKHGAKLVSALRALRPDRSFEFFGAGGDEMR